MNLTFLVRRVLGITAATTALVIASIAPVQAQQTPREGVEYNVLAPAQPVDTAGKIEVIEFFGYWCPHCNEFDPILVEWSKRQGPDVLLRHIPVAFRDQDVPLQRLYYVLEGLGKEAELRAKVFHAIHVENNLLDTMDAQADFAAKNGIDRKQYIDLYNSFTVQSKTARAMTTARAYGVDGIPFMAVAGKYTVSGQRKDMSTIDFLVAKERRAMPPVAVAPAAAPVPAVPGKKKP